MVHDHQQLERELKNVSASETAAAEIVQKINLIRMVSLAILSGSQPTNTEMVLRNFHFAKLMTGYRKLDDYRMDDRNAETKK